jgi:alpha-galactosidase
VQEFIIDDGWQINIGSETSKELWGNNYGDWEIDQQKFPGGLKPTFDYIKSLGMKPGLWISIGSATGDAKVFKEHPEWFVKNYKQRLSNLHFEADSSNFYSSCYGTDWFDYIKNAIVKLAREHGLAYAKLDFAVITSAYVTDDHNAGCFAVDHPYHKDQNESFLVIYNRVMELFDELHTEAPGLFIDCTFETVGKLQLMDYAIAKHAEGNWLSNFEEPSPLGPLRVRHMAWWRSPVLPATSLVIGNQQMDDPDFLLSFKSLAGTLPIVLGDPRKLSETQRKEIRTYADWLKAMQQKHDFTSFRQELAGFGEPMEGHWDGFQRINSETKSGGIVGIFRQGATEEKRMVTVQWLDPKADYVVLNAPDGKQITKLSGKELMELGFEVKLAKKYDGVLFEILKVI